MRYRLHDFLLFSPSTYYRLIENYNRDVWPLHLVAIAAGVAILWRRNQTILAICWIWVAYAFLWKRYGAIQWAAKYFALAFVVQAALLVIWPNRTGRIACPPLLILALFVQPFIPLLFGHPIEVFGIMPDPTVVATLAFGRIRLMIIPLLWLAFSGLTMLAMA